MSKTDKDEIRTCLTDIKRQLFQMMKARTERWVEADTLSKEIECMRPEWLKKFGGLLPRTRAEILMEDGTTRTTHWVYPLHRINEMFESGEIKNLQQLKIS